MSVSRRDIILALSQQLQESPSVHAMWLEGADAHGLEDEYSDIDVWLDVEDGHADAVLCSVREILSAIGPLDYDFEPEHPHPQIRQAFFHIRGTPEYMVLDVCIQDHSRESAYLTGYVDEKVKVLFDKAGVISYKDVDWEALGLLLSGRVEELRQGFPLIRTRLRKELARGNSLEALNEYHAMLSSLVEVLRIKYEPTKHDYGLKHIKRDLPSEVVARLEYLYAVCSLEDIEAKWSKIEQMLREVCDDLEGEVRG